MARALFEDVVQDQAGNVPPAGTPVTLYELGTTTPLAQSLYANPSGGAPLGTNVLTTNALGRVQAYADTAQRVTTSVTVSGTTTTTQAAIWPDPSTILTNTSGVSLTSPSITNPTITGVLRQKGPAVYTVEAYASAADLNSDGSFKFDRDCSYAVAAAAAAVRAYQFSGDSGTFGGRYNAKIVFSSRVYTAATPMNLTKLSGTSIESGCETSVIYCGDAFTSAGLYDSGVAGSGTAITAANSPMMSLVGDSDCLIRGIRLYAQASIAGGAPSVKPGAGFLVASLEVRSGGVFNGTGATFSSNNLVFERCSALGYFGAAGFLINNSVIHNFTDCGAQNWTNTANAHAFYCGRQTISPSSATPTASGGVDCPFYPDPSSPANGDERMNRTETAAGGLIFTNFEMHDMTGVARLAINPSDTGRSSTLSTMLLYKVYQVLIQGTSPMSSTGRAGIEVQGFSKNISLFGVEFYEDSSISGGTPLYWIYNNGCDGPTDIVENTTMRDCFVNTGTSAVFAGESNAVYSGIIAESNTLNGTSIYKTDINYTGSVTAETLTGRCVIDCGGLSVLNGGSIGLGVEFINPGTVTKSVGGNDKSRRITSAGQMQLQPGTNGSPAYSITGDTNTGMYGYAADQLALAVGGVATLVVSPGTVYFLDGASASLPGISYLTEGGLGIWRSGAGTGNLVSGGTARLTWNGTGVGFNAATPIAAPNFTISAPTADRLTLDQTSGTATEVREVLGTVVKYLINYGLFS